jgi:site-specific DNA recombinase
MTYHYTQRTERRYGYYVCLRGQKQGAMTCKSRAPAGKLESFVVERLRAVGRDPSVLRATMEADRADRESRRPELIALARRLESERTRLQVERGHVVEAISKGATSLVGQLAELDERLAEADKRAQNTRGELAALDLGSVDADEIRRRLEDLAPVWEELFPKERARVLALLIERIVFEPVNGEVAITFRTGGPPAARRHQPTPATYPQLAVEAT